MHKKILFAASCVLALNGLIHANANEFQRIATQTPAQEASAQDATAQNAPAQNATAQEPPKVEDLKRLEIKLDLIHALLTTFRMSSEYWVDGRNALALTALYNFSAEPALQGQVLASYKLYLIKYQRGPWFFAETNLGYTKGYEQCDDDYFMDCDEYDYDYGPSEKPKRYHAFAVGLAAGLKFFIPSTDTGIEGVLGFNRLYGTKKYDVMLNFGLGLIRRF